VDLALSGHKLEGIRFSADDLKAKVGEPRYHFTFVRKVFLGGGWATQVIACLRIVLVIYDGIFPYAFLL
jgi:hypothetical protein